MHGARSDIVLELVESAFFINALSGTFILVFQLLRLDGVIKLEFVELINDLKLVFVVFMDAWNQPTNQIIFPSELLIQVIILL